MNAETLPALAVPARAPLSPRTRNGMAVAAAAVALGAAGDALLRPAPWGLNLTLWTMLLVAAAAGLQRWADTEDAVVGWIPVALAVAALMSWRDSPTLKALDLTALCVVLGLAVHRARGGSVRVAGLARYCGALLQAVFDATCGAGLLVGRDVRWGELRGDGWTRHALAAGRGTALALPLLLIFGSLLMAADAGFDHLIARTFNLDLPLALSHTTLALVFAWGAAGVLRALVIPSPSPSAPTDVGNAPADVQPARRPHLGIVETATVLGLLDLLFLAFVVIQLPHFFGSYGDLMAPGTATFSEYARRGFFELCVVAGLVLPLLMTVHWLIRGDDPRAERVFRIAAGTMVGLVFVIILSALHRMRLYQSAYGLTELRVYTTAFMLWLTAVFGWFCWTVLRGRRERFAFGAVTAAVETIVLLHVASPDALIVRVNAAREQAVVRFDAYYAATLSGDAVPGLLRHLDAVPVEGRCHVARTLLREWSGAGEDWRAWSLGRARAVSAVRAHAAELNRMCPADAAPATAASPSAVARSRA
ncbi:MAG TPA: DUF4173 domain-containing protein [Longimicrobium sp.]|nr:DUF4173 domain-containing protein [Longimicrobium sp.]